MNQALFMLVFAVGGLLDAGVANGTEHEYSQACAKCGTGATPASPLRVRVGQLPNRRPIAQSYFHHLLVRDDLAMAIQAVTGRSEDLAPVQASSDLRSIGWKQILPKFVAPRMHAATRGIIRSDHRLESACAACDRDGYFHTLAEPPRACYDRDQFSRAWSQFRVRRALSELPEWPDFVSTWEGFGKSIPGDVIPPKVLAQPHVIVSQRVLDVLQSACRNGQVLGYPVVMV